MAKEIEIAKLDINVDELVKKTESIKKTLDELRLVQRELTRQGLTNSKQFIQNASDIKTLNNTYNTQLKVIGQLSKEGQVLSQQKQIELKNENLLQKGLDKSENTYNKVITKIRGVTAVYNDLATKQALGIKLSQEDQRELIRLQDQITKYNDVLKKVDADVGKYQRSVGNYASGWNGLSNSINQITREMPAFAVSMNTGFLAISNNLPILFDEIAKVNREVTALRAQGKPTESVLTRLAGSFFSLQTAMSLGVTLLTLYGKDLVEWAVNAYNAEKATNSLTIATNAYNEALKDTEYKNAYENVTKVKIAFEQARNGVISKGKALRIYNETLGETFGKTNDLNKAEDLFNKNSENYQKAMLARASANIVLAKSAELNIKILEQQSKGEVTFWEKAKAKFLDYIRPVSLGLDANTLALYERNEIISKSTKEIEANQTVISNLFKEFEDNTKGLNLGSLFDDFSKANKKIKNRNIELLKAQLDLYLSEQGIKERSESEKLEIEQEASKKRIAIINAEYEASNKKESDKVKLKAELQKEQNAIYLAEVQFAQDVADRELAIFVENNRKKLTENKYISNELKEQELNRLIELDIAETNALNIRYANGLISKENYELELLKIDNKYRDERLNLEREATEQQRTKDALDLQNRLATVGNNFMLEYQLKSQQLEQERQLRIANAIKTGEDVNIINEETAEKQKQLDQAVMDNKLQLAQDTFGQLSNIFGKESKAGKAMAVMQATVQTYQSAVSANAGMIKTIPGPVGMALGAVAAASAIATGLQNVRKITSTKEAKFREGGIMPIGGNLHTFGGTRFVGEDGTSFEAERGEGIAVLNRNAFSAFQLFNDSFRSGLGSSISQSLSGGNADIINAIKNMPAPIVTVEDINFQQNKVAKVVSGADF